MERINIRDHIDIFYHIQAEKWAAMDVYYLIIYVFIVYYTTTSDHKIYWLHTWIKKNTKNIHIPL